MAYDFAFHCNDGTMAHVPVPCDGTAHHSHVQITMGGSQSIDTMAMDEITRFVDWEIRDLLVDKARFRGPDQAALETSVTTDGVTAAYSVKFAAVYEQVRYRAGSQFPTFGTIDFTLDVERQRDADRRVFDATAQLVYGASGEPTTITIDGAHTYSLDLTTGAVVRL